MFSLSWVLADGISQSCALGWWAGFGPGSAGCCQPCRGPASLPGLRGRVPQSRIADGWAVPTGWGMFARSMGYN